MTISARFSIKRDRFAMDVDLTLSANGVTALFGPSGCGKTTLLRAIAGLDYYPEGFLQVGESIWQDRNHFVAPHHRSLGYVFQEASLFSHLTVQGNLEYGVNRTVARGTGVSTEMAIDLLEIGHLLKRKTNQLSGGERQRVAIARALAARPKLLLMDEPMAALDIGRKKEIMPYLESLHDELEIPILYVSHAPDEVARIADFMVLMDMGSIQATGAIDDILTRLDLPIAHSDTAGAVLDAVVTGHDDDYGLTYLEFSGGRFSVTHTPFSIGQRVRLQVAARDVSLTLERQSETSILNILPAVVDTIMPIDDSQVMVRILTGTVPILSRVTKKSAAILDLQKGKKMYAQVKSVAVIS